jgi:hypothetical protein
MGLPIGYRVQTKNQGHPWHTVRTWPGKPAAEEDARALFVQSHEIEGVLRGDGTPFTVPLHPRVRVVHGASLVLDLDVNRKQVA